MVREMDENQKDMVSQITMRRDDLKRRVVYCVIKYYMLLVPEDCKEQD